MLANLPTRKKEAQLRRPGFGQSIQDRGCMCVNLETKNCFGKVVAVLLGGAGPQEQASPSNSFVKHLAGVDSKKCLLPRELVSRTRGEVGKISRLPGLNRRRNARPLFLTFGADFCRASCSLGPWSRPVANRAISSQQKPLQKPLQPRGSRALVTWLVKKKKKCPKWLALNGTKD